MRVMGSPHQPEAHPVREEPVPEHSALAAPAARVLVGETKRVQPRPRQRVDQRHMLLVLAQADVSQQDALCCVGLDVIRNLHALARIELPALYDDPPRRDGLEVNRGLIDRRGRKKPAYFAYRRG